MVLLARPGWRPSRLVPLGAAPRWGRSAPRPGDQHRCGPCARGLSPRTRRVAPRVATARPRPGEHFLSLATGPGRARSDRSGPPSHNLLALSGIGRQDGCPGVIRLRRDTSSTEVAGRRGHKVGRRQPARPPQSRRSAASRCGCPCQLRMRDLRPGTGLTSWGWAKARRPLLRPEPRGPGSARGPHIRRTDAPPTSTLCGPVHRLTEQRSRRPTCLDRLQRRPEVLTAPERSSTPGIPHRSASSVPGRPKLVGYRLSPFFVPARPKTPVGNLPARVFANFHRIPLTDCEERSTRWNGRVAPSKTLDQPPKTVACVVARPAAARM